NKEDHSDVQRRDHPDRDRVGARCAESLASCRGPGLRCGVTICTLACARQRLRRNVQDGREPDLFCESNSTAIRRDIRIGLRQYSPELPAHQAEWPDRCRTGHGWLAPTFLFTDGTIVEMGFGSTHALAQRD